MLELARDQIRLAFEQAEKEVEDLRQRTREGIETARLNGKQIGASSGKKHVTKKSVKVKALIEKHSSDFEYIALIEHPQPAKLNAVVAVN